MPRPRLHLFASLALSLTAKTAYAAIPPSNDNFVQATVVADTGGSFLTYNTLATTEPGEPLHGGLPYGRSLWWSWTAPATGWANFSTYGSGRSLQLAIYTGETLETLSCVGVNTPSSGDSVSVPVLKGQTYRIAAAAQEKTAGMTATGPDRVVLTVNRAPTITSESLVRGAAGTALSYAITASAKPTSFSARNLPSGLTLNQATGTIGGTPAAAGTFDAEVSAMGPGGTATAAIRFEIDAAGSTNELPEFSSGEVSVVGYVGASLSEYFYTKRAVPVFTAEPLPPGLAATGSSTGTYLKVSGVPTQAGVFQTTLRAENGAGSREAHVTFRILEKPPLPILASAAAASATVGQSFSYWLSDEYVANDDHATTYAAGPLPPGLILEDEYIRGKPLSAGVFEIPISATNAAGTSHALLTLSVSEANTAPPSAEGAPIFSGEAGFLATTGSSFLGLAATTGAPATFSAQGLPDGLTLDPLTGLFSGTPSQPGNFTATISATNAFGTTSTPITFSVRQPRPPILDSAASAVGAVGAPFSYSLTASDSVYPSSYLDSSVILQAGLLPPGLTFSQDYGFGYALGTISGTPTQAGTYRVPVSATARGVTTHAVLTIVIVETPALPPVITSASTTQGYVGSSLYYSLSASNGGTNFTASGLPAGLALSKGVISGKPTETGVFVADVTASNAVGTTAAKITFRIDPVAPPFPSTSSAAAWEGLVGESFRQSLSFNNSGDGTLTYAAENLPPGLSLSGSSITGTPTQAGTFFPILKATNSAGTSQIPATIIIRALPDLPTISGNLIMGGTVGKSLSYYVSVSSNATVTAADLPPGLTLNGTTISGTPTEAGNYETSLSARNAAGTVTKIVTFQIAPLPPPPKATFDAATRSYVNRSLTFSFTADDAYNATYSLQGALPAGVSFDATNHSLTGIPTEAGTFPLVVTITTSGGSSVAPFTLEILAALPPPVFTSPPLIYVPPATTISKKLTASNNPTSYTVQGLPAGLSFNTTTGVLSGRVQSGTPYGNYPLTVTATNAAGTSTAVVTLLYSPSTASTANLSYLAPCMATVGVNSAFYYRISIYSTYGISFTATGLPTGLSLDASSGVISGVPTTPGIYSIELGTSPSSYSSYYSLPPSLGTLTLVVQANPEIPILSSDALLVGSVGSSFSSTIAARDASAFSAEGLPPGLTLNPTTGALRGTPVTAGRYEVGVTVSNNSGAKTFPIVFEISSLPPAPKFSGSQGSPALVGIPFSYSISASDSDNSYAADNLPPGLGLDASAAQIRGKPTTPGHYVVTLRASNPGGTATAKLAIDVVTPKPPRISSYGYVTEVAGRLFSYQIGGTDSPTSFAATGLPAGLVLDPSTGKITGIPTTPGSYSVQVSASNAGGTGTAVVLFDIQSGQPSWLTSGASAYGVAGSVFSSSLSSYRSDSTFSASGLPPGLSLAGARISGTPTAAGDYPVSVQVKFGDAVTTSILSIHIDAEPKRPPRITSALTVPVTIGAKTDYEVTASPSATEITVEDLPAGLLYDAAARKITGFPKSPGNHAVQLSAANALGTTSAQVNFVTVNEPAVISAPANVFLSSDQPVSFRVPTSSPSPISYYVSWPATPARSLAARGLPPGLYLNPSTGQIEGTATKPGDYPVELLLVDILGNQTSTFSTFHISNASVPTGASVWVSSALDLSVTGAIGSPFTLDLSPTGNATDISVEGLPPGISLVKSTGLSSGISTVVGKLTGTPTKAGEYPVKITFSNGARHVSATTTILIPETAAPPDLTGSLIASGRVASSFTYYLTESAVPPLHNAATTYSISDLPPGLELNLTRKAIVGIPTAGGRFTVPLTISNSGGATPLKLTILIQDFHLDRPRLTGSGGLAEMSQVGGLPAQSTGYVDEPFAMSLVPVNFVTSLTAEGLPDGLRLEHLSNGTWILRGKPQESGFFSFTLTATNAQGVSTFPLTIDVRGLDGNTPAPTPDPTPSPTPRVKPRPDPSFQGGRQTEYYRVEGNGITLQGRVRNATRSTRLTVRMDSRPWKATPLRPDGSFKFRISDPATGITIVTLRITAPNAKAVLKKMILVRSPQPPARR